MVFVTVIHKISIHLGTSYLYTLVLIYFCIAFHIISLNTMSSIESRPKTVKVIDANDIFKITRKQTEEIRELKERVNNLEKIIELFADKCRSISKSRSKARRLKIIVVERIARITFLTRIIHRVYLGHVLEVTPVDVM